MANGTVEAGLMSYCRVVLVTWDLSCLITAITAPQVRAGPRRSHGRPSIDLEFGCRPALHYRILPTSPYLRAYLLTYLSTNPLLIPLQTDHKTQRILTLNCASPVAVLARQR